MYTINSVEKVKTTCLLLLTDLLSAVTTIVNELQNWQAQKPSWGHLPSKIEFTYSRNSTVGWKLTPQVITLIFKMTKKTPNELIKKMKYFINFPLLNDSHRATLCSFFLFLFFIEFYRTGAGCCYFREENSSNI